MMDTLQIGAFFDALSRRQLRQCQSILAQLREDARNDALLSPWCTYLQGILIFESDFDWAGAERLFVDTLTRMMERGKIDPELRIRLHHALGRCLQQQGRWEEAIVTYKQTVSMAGEGKEKSEIVKAKAWKHIAICCHGGFSNQAFDSQKLELGIDYCQNALTVLDSLDEHSDNTLWLRGSIWNELGALHRYSKNWDESVECYQRDLAILKQLNNAHGTGIIHLNLGEVYQDKGESYLDLAEREYDQALTILRRYQDRYLEADVLLNLGTLYEQLNDLQQAITHYTQAIEVIEDLRTRVSAEEARFGFFTTMTKAYANLLQLHIKLDKTDDAFNLSERARSRSFIELLANRPIRVPQNIPGSLVNREQHLRESLQTLYLNADEHKDEVDQLESELNQTLQQIRLIDSEYTDLRTVHPCTVSQVQEMLPEKSALLSYFVTDSAIFAFVAISKKLTAHQLPITLEILQSAFDEANYLLRIQPDSQGRLHKPWMLERLYEMLIQPFVHELEGAEKLYILPHGPLHVVPIHALMYQTESGDTRTVLDDFQIVYAPSATVLVEYCQKDRNMAAQSLLAVGHNSDDLVYTEDEAHRLADLVEGATKLVDEHATASAIVKQAANFRWIHFACHAWFNKQLPLMSSLQLSDAPLYASDILQNLRLNAELVTLSACDTGRSHVLKGDELLGLVRAFMYAGTPSVVVTLWPVNELSTRIFMEHFYQQLVERVPKAQALRLSQQYLRELTVAQVEEIMAQLGEPDPVKKVADLMKNKAGEVRQSNHILEDKVFAHPYFWAPFVLIGDTL